MSYIIEKDWITPAGLRAIIIICEHQGRKTHRCGYVGVSAGCCLYKKSYHEQVLEILQEQVADLTLGKRGVLLALTATVGADTEGLIRRSPDVLFDVHGGLTYSGGGEASTYPVTSDLWWFGFDCRHVGDAAIEPDLQYSDFNEGVVRDLPYVTAECESLAQQIEDFLAGACS